MPPRRRAAGVLAAVRRDLRKLPEELRDCAEAAAALELARTMDQGMHIATSSKELRAVMNALRGRALSMAPADPKPAATAPEKAGPGIADLTARIASARRNAASG